MRIRLTILSLVLSGLNLSAQELYIPPGAELIATAGAGITATGEVLNSGRLEVKGDAEMVAFGDVTNDGFFINDGEILLFGDWTSTGTFNTSLGKMTFLGANDQTITNNYLLINSIEVNKIGTVTLSGDSTKVTESLNFRDGILTTSLGTNLIVDRTASITHTFGSGSYFEGELIARGTRNRIFPVGSGGFYGTIELIDLKGINPEVGVSLIHQSVTSPLPNTDLVGVSPENAWRVDLRNGSLDSALIQIDFIAEDLENFEIENDIRRRYESPVVVISDSIGGIYYSLGVDYLANTDSVTEGTISSSRYARFGSPGAKYFAVALAPQINPAGQIYFPNVFAPSASDPTNKRYRVFGEKIAESPFKLEIYNRFSTLVYSTNSFEEATTQGWDGRNLQGKEEYTGVYFIVAKYAYQSNPEDVKLFKAPILLKR
ncbi:gliding motility-associated C-terminal domain-containing protein [Marinoscillum sp. MHG1-6]|uniref:gliding motility-associated C-terminal domain-containing protein n=1 Tax=Marinoscillum sp. MHG1-6 TaxID=2959627 RepID=UPI0021586DB1|nr:gliding motility-associated C-terminal domain-containing protein [Marinoscillum sp. MHG1-6]